LKTKTLHSYSRNGIGNTIAAIIIVVILVGAALAVTYVSSTKGTSTVTVTGPITPTTSSKITLGPKNTSLLIDDSTAYTFDSLDPDVGFFWDGYFQNVFQGLDSFNGSNADQVVPALASSWKISSNDENYTFTMRPNTWFSNKDPVNAYVAWFSFVRVNYMNAASTVGYSNGVALLYSQNNAPDAAGNVWPWGLQNAIASAFHIPVSNENKQVAALNDVLSHFNTANASILALMSYPHQALVALNGSTFQINLIQPYSLFLLNLAPWWESIVDPVYIDANGGVANNTEVPAFNTNGMPGTGPYMYGAVAPGNTQLVLNANPNYWAIGVSGLAKVLEPPTIKTIIMNFALEPSTQIEDFAANSVQLATPPISQFQQAWDAYQYKSYFTFNQIFSNQGYPMCDTPTTELNTQVYPTNNTDLRQAIVHAVNYTEIQQQLYTYNGTVLGELFLPPVPPGYGPLDNPQNTPLYSTNINLAASYLNKAGLQDHFFAVMENGTVLGDAQGTRLAPITYDYIVPLTPQTQTFIDIMQANLAEIGISIAPSGLTGGQFEADLTSPQTSPQMTDLGWCADWPDPILQQFLPMATTASDQGNWVNNATLTALLYKIPFETNATQQLKDTIKAYQIFTQLASIVQQPQAAIYYFVQPYVKGLTYQPFEVGIYYNMLSYATATGSSAG
jgi:ABC-type transport system substrate-binding protein